MKVKLLIVTFLILGTAPSQADEGAWVKVNQNGDVVGDVIVCTPDVCGDRNSPYAQATLNDGERYVLQVKADPITKNVAGYGNGNPNMKVHVDPLNTWTLVTTNVMESPAHPRTNETVKLVTNRVETFNPITQPTPVRETIKTVERKAVVTDWNDPDFDWDAWWENWLLDWEFFDIWLNFFDWSSL